MPDPLPLDRAHPRFTAHHEAGHVLAHFVYREAFHHVTIRPDELNPGHLGMVAKDPVLAPSEVVGTITAAGPVAETHLRHVCGAEGYEGATPNVVATSVHAVCQRGHPELREAEATYPQAIDVAVELVAAHWATVEALALALLKSETLSYAECIDIADESGLFDRM